MDRHESARIAALERYALLDTAQDPAYDSFTRLAAEICGTPISLVTFIDSKRQWFKASLGLPGLTENTRDLSFCTHAIETDELMEVADATSDPRFAENPFVTGEANIRFYAGVPLVDSDGYALGTLCTFDRKPRKLTAEQRTAMRRLGAALVSLVESRKDVPEKSLEQQAVFNAAFEHVADPIAILRVPTGRGTPTISFANHAFGELFGYDQTELIGGNLRMLDGTKTDPLKMARLRAAALGREPGTETTFLYASTGSPRYVELRERVLDVAHRILSVRDLTRAQATQDILSDTNLRLQSLLANNSDGVLSLTSQSACVEANPAACAMLGFERSELLGYGFLNASAAGIFPSGELFPSAVAAGNTIDFDSTFQDPSGTPIAMECKAIPMIVRGATEGAYLVLKDVTEAKRLARFVEQQAQRTRSLYLISAGQHESGRDQIDAALQLVLGILEMDYGYVGRIVGDSLRIEYVAGVGIRSVGDLVPIAHTRVEQTIAAGDVLAIEDLTAERGDRARNDGNYHAYVSAPLMIGAKPYGAIGFVSKRIFKINEYDRDFVRLVATLIAASLERHMQKARLDELAFYDALTGLPNRAKFMQELHAAIARVERHGSSFALHFIDLDGFKGVNDLAGHAIGDEVLAEVARRLSAIHRSYDVPARLGGDEFVVLQSQVVERTATESLGRRIVDSLCEPFETSAGTMRIGASVGIALYPGDACDGETLLRRADLALYRAKALGKRRAEFYTSALEGQ